VRVFVRIVWKTWQTFQNLKLRQMSKKINKLQDLMGKILMVRIKTLKITISYKPYFRVWPYLMPMIEKFFQYLHQTDKIFS